MTRQTLRPWTEAVKLHPDVESGNTAVAAYALDLGALVTEPKDVPVAYRDPTSFFRITYPTSGLRRMLNDVFDRLAGGEGDRVLQLRSPFGGGKSHTLAALYHAAKDRKALEQIPECRDLPDPGAVRVAVFDGEKFDALTGKEVESSTSAEASAGKQRIRTMWGWLAWQLGKDAFERVRQHDEQRISPGGDIIAELLNEGPTLLLLDEVLKYLERASGDQVGESTHERQTKDFLHSLSVEVARAKQAVMVYSLQASAREAMGNIGLLDELDHLTSRVDAKREPVTLDEILPVLHRRLLVGSPGEAAARTAAQVISDIVTGMRVAHADTESDRRTAEEEGVQLRERIESAYPFHPGLIDVMRERWASLPDFQRTRGAIRLLAACMHSVWEHGTAKALLGPGNVPIEDRNVLHAFFTEVGSREAYQPVLTADLLGPNARVKRVDARLAKENPALAAVKPAMRIATAILMYSFGGLPKAGGSNGETLPPGVTETELLSVCVGPDLEHITARACLKDMLQVNGCLYLHYDGARYCFKTTPNVNALIEQEAQSVRPPDIRKGIRERLDRRLAGERSAFIWPEGSDAIPDREPVFIIAYMPLEFAQKSRSEQERLAKEMFEKCGTRPRRYRNGLGLAIPARAQLEPLRTAVRYQLAIERVQNKRSQHGLTREQEGELRERKRTAEAAEESAFRSLYSMTWLPKMADGGISIDPVGVSGRPLQATQIHARILELLTEVPPKRVHGTLKPRPIVERLRLGEGPEGQEARVGISTREVQDAFFGILDMPRLISDAVLKQAIADGVRDAVFGYCLAPEPPSLGEDGRFEVSAERVAFDREVAHDEVDLEDGFLILPKAMPALPEQPTPPGTPPPEPTPPGPGPEPPSAPGLSRTDVTIAIRADQKQLFDCWNAVANLAGKAGSVRVRVEAHSDEGFDSVWLRNAVLEPIEESGAETEDT